MITKKKKGSITLLFTFFVIAGLVILITSVFAPMGAKFSTYTYTMGERILISTNDSVSGIQDEEVKANLQGQLGEAMRSTEDNISIATDMFQYSWVWVLILSAMVIFLLTRRIVEYGGGII